jgi:hypothetical protein
MTISNDNTLARLGDLFRAAGFEFKDLSDQQLIEAGMLVASLANAVNAEISRRQEARGVKT